MIKIDKNKRIIVALFAFWPIIYGILSLIKFPSSILALIITIVSVIHILKNNVKYKGLFLSIMYCIIVYQILNNLYLVYVVGKDTSIFSNNAKYLIRWINFIVVLYLSCNTKIIDYIKSETILKYKTILKWIFILIVIQLIYMVLPMGYQHTWEGKYFKAYFYNSHVNGYFLIALQVYLIFIIKNIKGKIVENFSFLLSLIIMILSTLTGARTSSVASLVLFGYIFLIYIKERYKLIIFCILGIGLIILLNQKYGFIDITQIPLIEKTIEVNNSYSGFINGRDVIWGRVTEHYKYIYNIIQKVLGNGLGYSVQIFGLWSHNDLIETLIGSGIVGVAIYVYYLSRLFLKSKNIIFIALISVILFWNGLFQYTELVNTIPIFMLAMNRKKYEIGGI